VGVIAVGVDPDATGGLSLLSIQECAAFLGVSGEAVRRACRDGTLHDARDPQLESRAEPLVEPTKDAK
jgi:hypothetical protein